MLLCRLTVAVVILNIATGAAVRLSDSGLGCPDWPTCSQHRFTPALSLHPLLEFSNRMVVVGLVVLCALTLVAALLRAPRRHDLTWLAGGLIVGVVGEAVLGAFVVYSKLNPYVVSAHFDLGLALLAVAVVLALRADHAGGRGRVAVSPRSLRLSKVLLVLVAMAIVVGSVVTGTVPHAGGPGAKRIPVPLDDMVRTHSIVVLAAGAVLLWLLYLLWKDDASATIQDRCRAVLAVMVAQGVIGYTQFFTHLPPLLVGIHVLGAAVVWSATLWYYHGTSDHDREATVAPDDRPAPVGVAA